MTLRYGIDVSAYQGAIDWARVKASGCSQAVLKVTRRDLSADRQFPSNLAGCRKQGIDYDVYRYVYESDRAGAERAAKAVIDLLDRYGAEKSARVWWDVEDSSIRPSGSGERKKLSDSILAAQSVIEEAGHSFGLYCGWHWYRSVLDHSALTCPFWVARYPAMGQMDFGAAPETKYRPETVQPLWGWQFSSKGRIDGIGGHVDLNEIYLPRSAASASAPLPDPVSRFQLWLWEQGESRLAADGIFGPKSRTAAVRVLQRLLNCRHLAGLEVDGIFGKKTRAAVVTLKQGDRGNLVLLLQGLLYAAGEDPKGFDGIFGPGTRRAVESFQKKQGLKRDGLAGKETFSRLLME